MLRPRDSHDLRLIEAYLTLSPPPAATRWQHDALGNSIAVVRFAARAGELRIESLLRLEHFAGTETPPIAAHAQSLPIAYTRDEIADLGRSHERHHADPDHVVDAWARRFLTPPFAAEGEPPATARVLEAMTRDIHASFEYVQRDAYGTRDPLETLRLRSGTCRDFALLMMEALRSLGLAARFVSGYVYDPERVAAGAEIVGSGSTHAWVQVYLPGAGWVEYDPTNGKVGGAGLLRVAVTREPGHAVPVSGSFIGLPDDALPMVVEVTIRRVAEPRVSPPPAPETVVAAR
jgi:transglutaminase-like putative cysteine protease